MARLISLFIYGQFLEHAGNLVDSSLWCEMLDDRKFYYAVIPKPPEEPGPARVGMGGFAGRRRGVGPGRWNTIGPVDSVVMDTNNPFVGDHTPLIKLSGDEPRGIRQTDVNLHAKCHLPRTNSVGWRFQRENFRQHRLGHQRQCSEPDDSTRRLERRLQGKVAFSLKAEHSGPAQFEIVGTGAGSFPMSVRSRSCPMIMRGWRPDAIAVLKSLNSGVYRWPGGNYVSAFEWRDAIGDPDKRPPIYDPVWRAVQPRKRHRHRMSS